MNNPPFDFSNSLDGWPLDQVIGQLICPTLFGGDRHGETYDDAAILAAQATYGWGGYILFHGEADATRARLGALQAASRVPLLVGADMEHGAGQQIAGLTVWPTAMAFGAADDLALTRELGATTAREALGVGINWIFAPVADVANNPYNPIIAQRSFGGDPERVAAHVAAFVEGCQAEGALACAKHFPGHGDTATDSHTRLGTVTADRARLEAVEWPPFRRAIESRVASLMTAHLAVPAIGAADRPATLEPAIMTGLLRTQWGYEGLVVTDAMVMGGITAVIGPDEAAVGAIAAGCDMLLMPPDPARAHQALMKAVAAGRLPEARVREAAGRVLAAKRRIGVASTSAPEAGALARRVAERALTLAKGEDSLSLAPNCLAMAVDDGADTGRLAVWDAALKRLGVTRRLTVSADTPAAVWDALTAAVDEVDQVLIAVFSPIRVNKGRALLATDLLTPLEQLMTTAPHAVVISFGSPYVVSQFPAAGHWLLAYGSSPVQIEATLAVVAVGGPYPGRIPVTLPARLRAAQGGDRPSGNGPAFA